MVLMSILRPGNDRLKLSCHSLTNAGKRKENEDYTDYFYDQKRACFVLCDGLGGHGGGAIAARFAVDSVLTDFSAQYDRKDFLDYSILKAHAGLRDLQQQKNEKSGMRTTMVMLTLQNQTAQWVHSGDSRLYFFDKGKLAARTCDHSIPQLLVKQGQIREQDIRFHEERNRLFMALGTAGEEAKYEKGKRRYRLRKGQAFLLCTDGFWELIEDNEMESCLQLSATPKEWLSRMGRMVDKDDRANDNYTALGIFIH